MIIDLKFAFSLLYLSVLPCVSAHGYLAFFGIGGGEAYTNYTGNVPNANPTPSVIRQVSSIDPVKGASNPDLNCGQDAQFAQKVATVMPGNLLVFDWRGGDNTNWPHNTGPMLTYMTSCGTSDCTQYNSSSSKWFKVAEIGIVTNGTSGSSPVWAQQSVMNGAFTNVTLPSTLAPGNYLIRHEIIALHLATTLGGAEFYPACVQIQVGGNETGMAQDSEMVLFPGGYKDTDPGIYDPDVYSSNSYDFPGPPIAAFVSSSPTPSASPPSSSETPSPSSGTGTTSQGICKLQRRFTSSIVGSTSPESNIRRSKRILRRTTRPRKTHNERRNNRRLSFDGLWKDLVTAFSTLDFGQ